MRNISQLLLVHPEWCNAGVAKFMIRLSSDTGKGYYIIQGDYGKKLWIIKRIKQNKEQGSLS